MNDTGIIDRADEILTEFRKHVSTKIGYLTSEKNSRYIKVNYMVKSQKVKLDCLIR